MSHDGREVANYVLDQCDSAGREVTHLSLQKIVYFCHVWSLIQLKRPMVQHSFEAWEFGPVLPYLYRDFQGCGSSPIKVRAQSLDALTGERKITTYRFDREAADLLAVVVDFYSRLPASELVRMSHLPGSPWHEVWNHSGSANPGMKISDETIAHFYSTVEAPFLLSHGTYQ